MVKQINQNLKFSYLKDFHIYWSQSHSILPVNPRFLNVVLDICNVCNLRCRFCFLSSGHNQPKPLFYTPQLLLKDIEDLLPYTKLLRLSCGYEPLMSPHFVDILKMLAKYKIPNLELVSNATLLTPDKAEAIIQYGVTNLLFSLDTPDKATYEYIRRGADFEKVVNNIRWLKSRKLALHSRTPSLTLIAVLMRRNIEQMDALVDLAEELGVTHMDLRHLEVYDGLGMEGEKLGPETQAWSDPILNRIRDKALAKGISLITPDNYGKPYIPCNRASLSKRSMAFLLRWSIGFRNALNHPSQAFSKLINITICKLKRIFSPGLTAESIYCEMPFNHVFVGMDGRVMACPHIDDLRNSTSSDRPQKLIDVFLGDKFNKLREGSISGKPPQKCLQCPHCRLYAQNRESQDSK